MSGNLPPKPSQPINERLVQQESVCFKTQQQQQQTKPLELWNGYIIQQQSKQTSSSSSGGYLEEDHRLRNNNVGGERHHIRNKGMDMVNILSNDNTFVNIGSSSGSSSIGAGVSSSKMVVDQHAFNNYTKIVHENTSNLHTNHGIVISSSMNADNFQSPPPSKIVLTDSNAQQKDNGKFTFHNTVVNQQKKKRKKKEVLEGCNHFKIDSSNQVVGKRQQQTNGGEDVENVKRKKIEKLKQVQVSNFDLLATTDNNAMFGVFKKNPSQQAYESVLNFNQVSNIEQQPQMKPPQQPTPSNNNNLHSETQISTTPSPIHNLSSNSSNSSLNSISQQGTFPNPSNSNTYISNGFNNNPHQQSNTVQATQIGSTPYQQHFTTLVNENNLQSTDLNQTSLPIGSSTSQPKRDLSNLNYGTLTRSGSPFQSATDLLFSEKQNVKQDPVTEVDLSKNQFNDYSNNTQFNKRATSSTSSMNENRINYIESSSRIPSIKELFK